MKQSGTAVVDHHQFVLGSPTTETYEPAETGSVMEVGPGFVTVKTGAAYGPVALTVEVLAGEPEPTSDWDVVEEATITVSTTIRVVTLDGELAPGFDRVPVAKGLNTFRVSARGRDTHQDLTVDDPTESYLVQVWKVTAPAVMRRLHKTDKAFGGEIVTHTVRNFWDPDPAGDATLHLKYGYEQMAIWAKQEAIDWGGRPPTETLRRQAYAKEFAAIDRMLVDALVRCRAPKLKKIAAWGARRAYTIAGVADIEWIRDGLDALDKGEALPYPFDDRNNVWDAFLAETRIELRTDTDAGPRGTPAAQSAHAISDASYQENPLTAVFSVLRTAVHIDGGDYPRLVADLRRAFFPKLAPADQYERWIGYTV